MESVIRTWADRTKRIAVLGYLTLNTLVRFSRLN